MNYFIKTFGCQMNVSDSLMIEQLLQERGFDPIDDVKMADLIVVNTCSVREKAETKAEGHIKEYGALKKEGALLWVVGCMAERIGEELCKRVPSISRVIGAPDLEFIENRIDAYLSPLGSFEQKRSRGNNSYSSFISIMRGCDNFCTYCIVPFVRGREHSISVDEICRSVREALENGAREVTLLGQNVNSYYSEDTDFTGLLRKVHEIEGIERIRFTTSHPKDISDELIEAVAELPKLCNHIHLPVQSGSSRILDEMNRSYTRESYLERIRKIRDTIADVDITTDVMVGFPGEEEADFEETLTLFEEADYTAAFMFAYSPRSGTPAASMSDSVDDEIKSARLQKLIQKQTERTKEHYSKMVGKEVEVYCTYRQEKGGGWVGQDYGAKRVLVKTDDNLAGKIVRGRVDQSSGMTLIVNNYRVIS